MSIVKKRLLEYSITIVACALLTFLFAIALGLFTPLETMVAKYGDNYVNETAKLFHILCSATFMSGLLCVCFGGLVFINNGGFFDIIFYGLYRFFTLFNFKKHPDKVKYPTFYDYRLVQDEKPDTDFLFLLIVGAFYIGLSMLFLSLWYRFNVPAN